MTGETVVFEELGDGIRYVEEQTRTEGALAVTDCFLVENGKDEPIAMLDRRSFEQRFGAVSIAMEGIGGVETQPRLRRRGWMAKLLERVLSGASRRVSAVAVGDAIPGVYEKYGFVSCVPDRELLVDVFKVMSSLRSEITAPRALTQADLPNVVRLYNEAHSERPWTHQRGEDWNKLLAEKTWSRGSEGIVVEHGGTMQGYAIFVRALYGHGKPEFRVDEMAARDRAAAQILVRALGGLSWQSHQSQFTVYEPADSAVGRALKELGCVRETHHASGGMMARVLVPELFLTAIEPELRRRCDRLVSAERHATAFQALSSAKIKFQPGDLVSLVAGYWSFDDAVARGRMASDFDDVLQLWFPGGGNQRLPSPHAHRLDRY